jgi:poly(beta-D-mannuronate) lyase
MKNKKIKFLFLFLLFKVLSYSMVYSENRIKVHDIKEFNVVVANAKPGDIIVLSNGIWNNTELLFEAKGTATQPITLSVEEKGKVILSGASNLRIAGEYLVVEGLVFKNGYTPTTELISFRKDSKSLSNHCRLTQCVIEDFSNPERQDSDYWISIYGNSIELTITISKVNETLA